MVVKMAKELSVIAGCMFSGKSTEIIRQFDRNLHAGLKGQAFNAAIDIRYGKKQIIAHKTGDQQIAIPATPVPIDKPEEILANLKPDTQFVAVDEAQFFSPEIVDVVKNLLERNIQVIIAGLPNDFKGEPFGSMPILMALADQITLLTAVCKYSEDGKICGKPATKTQRLINGKPANYDDPLILVGGEENYTARCSEHHFVPGKPEVLFDASGLSTPTAK